MIPFYLSLRIFLLILKVKWSSDILLFLFFIFSHKVAGVTVALVSPSICFDLSNRTKASEDRPFPSKRWEIEKLVGRYRHLVHLFRFLTSFKGNGRSSEALVRLLMSKQIEWSIKKPGHSHQKSEKLKKLSDLVVLSIFFNFSLFWWEWPGFLMDHSICFDISNRT